MTKCGHVTLSESDQLDELYRFSTRTEQRTRENRDLEKSTR